MISPSSSGRVSGRCGLCRHLRRRSAGDPHAGSPSKHQLRRHLRALRLRGVSRRCGACEGVGRATSVPWPGAHSCRATTQAEPGRPGGGGGLLCGPIRLSGLRAVSGALPRCGQILTQEEDTRILRSKGSAGNLRGSSVAREVEVLSDIVSRGPKPLSRSYPP
jgi:hypothetical protein